MPQQILDTYVDDAVARVRSAQDQDVADEFEKEIGQNQEAGSSFGENVLGWTKQLPRNIGMGTFRAALNTVEAVDDIFQAGAEFIIDPPVQPGTVEEDIPEPLIDVEPVPPLRTLFPGVFEAAHNFADESEELNTMSDDITQGITQFVIPFTGYLKAMGGLKNTTTLAKVGRLALSEGITAATAFEAHEGRVADLVEMGRQMENSFGALLNKISPEGSLANSYINYMTDRENESEMKGRFKNAVDSLVVTSGIVAVLKAVGISIKAAAKHPLKLLPALPIIAATEAELKRKKKEKEAEGNR